jgi:DNA-binding transcriptional LysR family regulator
MLSIERKMRARAKVRHLQVIVCVEKYRNVGRAAEYLNLAQPAVTKSLREIEDILGVHLFERTAKGVMPTHYALVIVKHAKSILVELRHMEQELSSMLDGVGSRLVLGSQLVAEPLLPEAISKFKSKFPYVTLTVIDGDNDQLIPAVRGGDIDMLVGRLPQTEESDGLKREALFEEQVWVMARKEHPLAYLDREVGYAELANYQWVLPLHNMTAMKIFETSIIDAGYSLPQSPIETVSSELVSQLLIETDMIGLLPKNAVDTHIIQGTLARIATTLQPITGSIGITTSLEREPTTSMQAMLEYLRGSVSLLH